MLRYAREAVELSKGRSREDLEQDRLLLYALTHLVEVVGEVAARIGEEGQRRYSRVPLREARTMRNRLIHGYDAVDLNVLWDTIQIDLPALIVRLCEGLGEGD